MQPVLHGLLLMSRQVTDVGHVVQLVWVCSAGDQYHLPLMSKQVTNVGIVVQLVWVCTAGDQYYLPLHIILLLRLLRMQHVFLLMRVSPSSRPVTPTVWLCYCPATKQVYTMRRS